MDKNQDGVITIDEFIECCQKVKSFIMFLFWLMCHIAYTYSSVNLLVSLSTPQEENIVKSMYIFENTIWGKSMDRCTWSLTQLLASSASASLQSSDIASLFLHWTQNSILQYT